MPSAAVLTKDLTERRWPVASLGGILAAFTFAALAISASLGTAITDITEGFPDALTSFMGGEVPGGYVVGEVFNLIAPLALVTYAVLTGAGAVAGEEEAGTMDLLAAQPVSRSGILAAKVVGLAVALTAATALFALAAVASSALFGTGPAISAIIATCVHLLLVAMAFGALALAVGAATGRPNVGAGVAGLIAAVSYLTNAMLPLAGFGGWAPLSPWYYYAGSEPLLNGLSVGHLIVLAAITFGALAVAFYAFEHRDLKG
ncbi:MAG: ABC transporter permease [Actinomycetia bacterium]|nr:ABC transporter permease [Actinomycetes bacterium]MCH9701791.1 ABC transporter permease [Actinomycetes bacterium]MCH9760006.1 ABC transporter permease [Actinomycetes bacterium]